MKKTFFTYAIDRAVGKAIKETRIKNGFNMRELAAKGNVPTSYICKIETNDRRLTLGEIEELSKWVGIDSKDIINRAKEIVKQENNASNHFCNDSNSYLQR